VSSSRGFSLISPGTENPGHVRRGSRVEGVIDVRFEWRVMVAWDLLDNPLPRNYKKHIAHQGQGLQVNITSTRGACRGPGDQRRKLIRDGFAWDELHYLEIDPNTDM